MNMNPSICGQTSIFVPTADPCTNCEHLEEDLRQAQRDIRDMKETIALLSDNVELALAKAQEALDAVSGAIDVIEAYPISGATELSASWLSLTNGGSALTPETGKIYVLLDDSTTYTENTMFRWTGTSYVQVGGNNGSEYTLITNPQIDSLF